MSFTYDLTTAIGRVRFLIQDTAAARALFTDEEIGSQLAQYPPQTTLNPAVVNMCAADLCLILVTKFAQYVTRTVGKVSASFSDRIKFYSDLEKRYRQAFIGDATPWAGGVDVSDFDANNENNGVIHNYFVVGSDRGRDDDDKSNW